MKKARNRFMNTLPYLCLVGVIALGLMTIVGTGGGGGGGDGDNGDTQAPSVPSNLIATASSSDTIDLSWNASTDNVGVTSYIIDRDGAFLKSVASTSTSDTGLNSSTRYCYRVSAIDAANNESAQSTQVCATTITSLLAPSDLTATAASSSGISLAWSDNSDNEDGFLIEGSLSSNFDTLQTVYLVDPDTENYTDAGLVSSTTYYYRVSAYNAAEESDYSDVDSATTEDASGSPPLDPSGLTATATSSSGISLAWSDNSDDEDGFRIERSLSSNFDTLQATFLVGPDTADYIDSGLYGATTYYYRIRAYHAGGTSGYSNVDWAETDEEPCALEVTDWQPRGSIESTRPLISATFRSACGADIDVSSIEMIFDDLPVTPTITGSGSEVIVTYRPDEVLPMETNHEVTVRARDVNGVSGEKTWEFYIPWFY